MAACGRDSETSVWVTALTTDTSILLSESGDGLFVGGCSLEASQVILFDLVPIFRSPLLWEEKDEVNILVTFYCVVLHPFLMKVYFSHSTFRLFERDMKNIRFIIFPNLTARAYDRAYQLLAILHEVVNCSARTSEEIVAWNLVRYCFLIIVLLICLLWWIPFLPRTWNSEVSMT